MFYFWITNYFSPKASFFVNYLYYNIYINKILDILDILKKKNINFQSTASQSASIVEISLCIQTLIALILLAISIVCLLFYIIQRSTLVALAYVVLFLGSVFLSLFFLGFEFLSMLFLIVYIGAVVVLFLFFIFLVDVRKLEKTVHRGFFFWLSLFLSSCLFFIFLTVVYDAYRGTLVENAEYCQLLKDLDVVLSKNLINSFGVENRDIYKFMEDVLAKDKDLMDPFKTYKNTLVKARMPRGFIHSVAYYHQDIYLIGYLLYTHYYLIFLVLGLFLFIALVCVIWILYKLPADIFGPYKINFFEKSTKKNSECVISKIEDQYLLTNKIVAFFIFIFVSLIHFWYHLEFQYFLGFPIVLCLTMYYLIPSIFPKARLKYYYFVRAVFFSLLIIFMWFMVFPIKKEKLLVLFNIFLQKLSDFTSVIVALISFIGAFLLALFEAFWEIIVFLLFGFSEIRLLNARILFAKIVNRWLYVAVFSLLYFLLFDSSFLTVCLSEKTDAFFYLLRSVDFYFLLFFKIGVFVFFLYLFRVFLYFCFISKNYQKVFCWYFFFVAFYRYVSILFLAFIGFYLLFFLALYIRGFFDTYSFIEILLENTFRIFLLNCLNFQQNHIFVIMLYLPLVFLIVFLIVFFFVRLFLVIMQRAYYVNKIIIVRLEHSFYCAYDILKSVLLFFNLIFFLTLILVHDFYIDHQTYLYALLTLGLTDSQIPDFLFRLNYDAYQIIFDVLENSLKTDPSQALPTLEDYYRFEVHLYKEASRSFFNISWNFDLISIFLVGLTIIIFSLCFVYNWNSYKALEINFLFFQLFLYYVLEITLIYFFLTDNLLVFYILFEFSLLPTLLLIWYFGKRSRRFFAGYSFIIYTGVGSVLFLFVILFLYFRYNTFDISLLKFLCNKESEFFQRCCWLITFLTFAVKVPLVPFHSWLPETHVEAPTAVSVILAALLLKLGLYGFLRILVPFFPLGTLYFTPFVLTLSLISLLYSTVISFYQIDIKKIIAYSSIAHMSGAVISLFLGTQLSILSFLIMIFSHAFVSAALFFLVGCLYDRYGSRLIKDFGGLTRVLPRFGFLCFFFFFSNVGLPGTPNFWSEFYMISSLFSVSVDGFFSIFLKIFVIVLFLTAVYNLVSMVKILFGEIKNIRTIYEDLNFFELLPLVILLIFSLFLGIYPTNYYTMLSVCVNELEYFLNFFKK